MSAAKSTLLFVLGTVFMTGLVFLYYWELGRVELEQDRQWAAAAKAAYESPVCVDQVLDGRRACPNKRHEFVPGGEDFVCRCRREVDGGE